MKGAKLSQIARIRGQVAMLRREPHAELCVCCADDLNAIEECADAPFAPAQLARVRLRIELSRLPDGGRALVMSGQSNR